MAEHEQGPTGGTTNPRARIPGATYRLQFHKDFTFDDAIEILPYLARLGITHVYCSPIQRARPGSLHGYDVVAHNEINPELGGQEGFDRFCEALRLNRLGQLLDVVPNHMGVGADNPWWMDVLENGPSSPYAAYFDIDWHPLNPELEGKILLPVLGDHFGEALERGELSLAMAPEGAVVLRYGDHVFPVSLVSLPPVLALAADQGGESAGALATIAEAIDRLGQTGQSSECDAGTWVATRTSLRQSLARLIGEKPQVANAVGAALDHFNSPAARDALEALIAEQNYRLSFWRVAADEINYRRFFDVNELAALRMERHDVFHDTQCFALDLAASGKVDGLRIDHPDGLRDPARYFDELQAAYAQRTTAPGRTPPSPEADERPARPLYVIAEKISSAHEEVPTRWAIHGTTGYRFANVVNGVFVDTTAAGAFAGIWQDFTGDDRDFQAVCREGKRSIIRTSLSSELHVLSTELVRIARAHRRTRDYTLNALRRALSEVTACMTVYRTYVVSSASPQDVRFIDAAVAQAKEESDELDLTVFDFVGRTLQGKTLEGASDDLRARVLQFAVRYQQFSAPVAAKGVEDTAFYRYFPLASLNEVGGEPATFGLTTDEFHSASADRALRWPYTMLATSTHDNKRSEDVRMRLDVLSEMPRRWAQSLARWHDLGANIRSGIRGGRRSPSRPDEYLLYQTILGTVPAGGLGGGVLPAYRERIQQYMLKAVREAKVHTRWAQPVEAYESPLREFIDAILSNPDENAFLADIQSVAAELSWCGAMNSLSQMILKYASPGVPDLYQGNEFMDLSLVDPDNRRPVDYALRARALDALQRAWVSGGQALADALRALATSPEDGHAKLWLIWRMLAARSSDPALFRDGAYVGLAAEGERRNHVIAFQRKHEERSLIVLAGRFFAGLGARHMPRGGDAWKDTRVPLAGFVEGTEFLDVLTGATVRVRDGGVLVAEAFREFSGAALYHAGN